jgi:hypothetical protein
VDVTLGPRSGEPLPPPVDPSGEFRSSGELTGHHHHAAPLDRSALRRPPAAAAPEAPGAVYRTRNTGLAAVLVALTVIFEVPAFRVFASSALASHIVASGTFASMFMIAGLPLFAFGLYGLSGGAAAAPGSGWRAWLRPPLAYLPMGLLLFLAAAVAA